MTTASTPKTVAVVGCTHAGTFAAHSIHPAHPDWTVHVVERNDTLSFRSCGIALWVGGHVLEDGRVMLCKNWDNGKAIKENAMQADSVAVIGAGYIGAELVEQFSEAGVRATLIDGLDRALAKNFDAPITEQVEAVYAEHGVELALGQMVTEFRLNESGAGVTVVTTAGEDDVDHAIMGAGFLPRTDLFEGQLETLPTGANNPDEYMRAVPAGSTTVSSDILAAADSCTVLYNPTGTDDYIPLATNAVRQALLVAANIEEAVQKYMGTQATSAVQLYDLSLAASGLTQAGAEARGVNARSTTIVQDYRPDFMLTTTPVTATLTTTSHWPPTPCARPCSWLPISRSPCRSTWARRQPAPYSSTTCPLRRAVSPRQVPRPAA